MKPISDNDLKRIDAVCREAIRCINSEFAPEIVFAHVAAMTRGGVGTQEQMDAEGARLARIAPNFSGVVTRLAQMTLVVNRAYSVNAAAEANDAAADAVHTKPNESAGAAE